jgi:hypothetical protein
MRFTETLGADDIPKRRDRKHQCNGLSAQEKEIQRAMHTFACPGILQLRFL